MITFDREEAPLPGHRLYTRVTTFKAWGAGGERRRSFEAYRSRGRKVTWPLEPGNWSTCRLIRPDVAKHWLPPEDPEYWLEGRLCRFPESIVTGRRWAWPVRTGYFNPLKTIMFRRRAIIVQQNDGPTAEWLAERNAAGFAKSHGEDGNRIERALVAEKSPLVATLRQVGELIRPPVVASNDNQPSGEVDDENAGTGMERKHNQGSILPSVPMLLRAYDAGVASGVRELKDGWHRIGPVEGRRKLTGLIFLDGELVAYGDDRGRRRKPRYDAKVAEAEVDPDSETAKHTAAQTDENKAYTKMKAAGAYVSAQSPNAPRSLNPPPRTARAVANDNVLAKAIANTAVMPTVKKLPDGVAAEYGRLAGIAELKGVGGSSAPMPEALSEMDRADQLEAAGFRRRDLEVIEEILADASFRTIGLQFGYAESSASRMGRKVVEDTLERISKKIAA